MTISLKPVTIDDINGIHILCEPEYEAPEDHFDDAEQAAFVRGEIERGNDWGWCTIQVAVEWNGVLGYDYLGCCSYKSEQDFVKSNDYYLDMVNEAIRDLNEKLAHMHKTIEPILTV